MAVIILIKRPVPPNSIEELTTLLNKLRSVTLMQRGYISGQTHIRIDKPNECLVISNWNSVKEWENWFNSSERRKIQFAIDALLGAETTYEIYN